MNESLKLGLNYLKGNRFETKNEKRRSAHKIVWEDIDYDNIEVKLENGKLTITLPKLEKVKKRKIDNS